MSKHGNVADLLLYSQWYLLVSEHGANLIFPSVLVFEQRQVGQSERVGLSDAKWEEISLSSSSRIPSDNLMGVPTSGDR